MQVRLMRLLREKHHITSCRLARASGVSRQRLAQIENEDNRPTEHMRILVESAFEKVVADRRLELGALEADYLRYRDRLLEYIPEKPYNKHWDAGISGCVEVDENGWLHITLNTLLPHCKYQTSPYLKDTLVRLLSNYQLGGGTLSQYQTALLVIDEHCAVDNRRAYDQDNKGWKAIPNALKCLVIADDDQFSLGVALISTWDKEVDIAALDNNPRHYDSPRW